MGPRREFVADLRPVVQRGRIEVGTVRPRQRSNLGVENDGIERGEVLKWPEHRAFQHWPEINTLLGTVRERHRERVGANDVETRDPMNGMGRGSPKGFNLDWRLTGLQEVPIALQFVAVNLCPCFDEPLLRLWQAAAQALDRIDGVDDGVILVVRVEMRAMVWATR